MSIQNNQGPSSLSKIFFLVFFVTAFLSGAKAQTTQGVLDADYNALMDLYNSTGGGVDWIAGGWNTTDVSTWEGVTVAGDRVVGISLPTYGLNGPLPATMGNLTALQTLDLSDNILSGPIPVELFTIGTLTSLNLSINSLDGSIPDPSAMTLLTSLNLSDNSLSGAIPATIGSLAALTELDLSYNQLDGQLPGELFIISGIQTIRVYSNFLSGPIPDAFSTSIITLDLGANQLTGGVPLSMTTIPGLTNLYLEDNQLTDLPVFTGLTEFTVGGNYFDFGDIEPNISIAGMLYDYQLPVPKYPDVDIAEGGEIFMSYSIGGTNNVYQWYKDGLPIDGENLSSITISGATSANTGSYYLEITNTVAQDLILTTENTLVTIHGVTAGIINPDYVALQALYNATAGDSWNNTLALNAPWFTGDASTWHGVTVANNRVTNINLANNGLSGSIPATIEDLTALETLHLQGNQLSDPIPATIGSLTALNTLHLGNNQLTGGIPIEVGFLGNLTFLDLSQNLLTGGIPPEIGALFQLTSLNLHMNQLSGDLPAELWNLTNLTSLSLFMNQLTGAIPEDIGALTNLNSLQLTSNMFSGAIPNAIGTLTNLSSLAISGNQFSGSVPAGIGSLPGLTYLGLGDNELTELPDFSEAPWNSTIDEFSAYSNYFTFEDIEPNVGIANFNYNTQKSIPAQPDVTVTENNPFSISYTVGGTDNTYQWYKNGAPVGTNSSTYSVAAATMADNDYYYLAVTSPTLVPDLTLYTDQTLVTVNAAPLVETDSLALVEIFNALGGTGWFNNNGWLQLDAPVNTWYGVTVSGGRVTGLSLPSNNLAGAIPAAIGELDGLQMLNLNSNPIIDPIPGEIGNLTALTFLGLGQNYNAPSITALPTSIGNLTALTILDISGNRLDALPAEIGSLANLQELHAGSNQLTALPDVWGGLASLRSLNIEGNQISAYPASLGELTTLESVFINYNQFTAFPSFVGASSGSLRTLFMQGNQFAEIPAEINTLSVLEDLAIGNEAMTAVPASIFAISTLKSLYVYNSPLGTIPEEVTGLTNLLSLGMAGCGLTGELPAFLTTMPSLAYLDVAFNSLTTLPDFTGSAVENLRIGFNQLPFGEIEKVLAIPTLDYSPQNPIQAADEVNPLIGEKLLVRIPVSGSNNQYQWYKDEQIFEGFQTDSLVLASVAATDGGYYRLEVTSSVVAGLTLTTESIFVNPVEPVLETDSLALVAIYNATGGANWNNNNGWLQPGLPVANWAGVTVEGGRVTSLNLYGNQLAGTIPSQIGDLTGLQQLFLAWNQLVGDVPQEITNLTLLQHLDLGSNELTNLPDLTGLTSMAGLYLQDNYFTFEDLEPNVGIPGISYGYQKEVQIGEGIEVVIGAPLAISATVGGTGNQYQWFKNSVFLDGFTTSTYSVASSTTAERGRYYMEITNPAVPGLLLRTQSLEVEVLSPSYAYESGYVFWKKIGAETSGIFQHFPSVLAKDGLNNIYALDKDLKTINKFSASGELILSIPYPDYVSQVSDMAADAAGNLYISDESSSTIVKFDASGTFVYTIENTNGAFGIAIDSSGDLLFLPRNTLPFRLQRHSGSSGAFLGEIELTQGPEAGIYLGFELDPDGNIFLSEPSVGRIDKFSSAGAFVSSVDLAANGYSLWSGWYFSVAANGDIYFQVNYNSDLKVFHFGSDGSLISKFGDFSTLPSASGITTTADGILVADQILGLQQFDLAGNFIQTVGPRKDAAGQFNHAQKMAIDAFGNRYITDYFNGRIQKFDDEGTFLSTIGSLGTGAAQLQYPISVAVDAQGQLFVADSGNDRIQVFSAEGTHLYSIGGTGSADGQFSKPIAVSISGEFLFVLDAMNNRVQKFDLQGNHLLSFGSAGSGEGQFTNLNAMVIEADGNILIANNQPTKWVRFTQDGQFVEEIDLGIEFMNGLSTDNTGAVYVVGENGIGKADRNGGLLTQIGFSESVTENDIWGALAVSSNAAGDTLWISSSPNRVSIFYAAEPDLPKLDSLTLVELYNATGGTNWTNNSNWLSGNISTWFGVTVFEGRVIELSLPNNNLSGALPPTLGQLSAIQRLALNDNALTDAVPVSVLEMTGLSYLDISNNDLLTLPDLSSLTLLGVATGDELRVFGNKFQFTDLLPNITVPNYSYSPQQEIPALEPITISELEALSLSYTIEGEGTTFQWMKDGAPISGATAATYSKAQASTTDAGIYYLTATNPGLPGLTLATGATTVTVNILSVPESERSALADLYNATGGAGWTNKTNWLVDGQDVNTWHGVTVVEGRVTKIDLSNNNLIGAVPASFANLTALAELVLNNNQLTGLPDLSALALTTFNVSTNALTFEDLEPNIAKLTTYSPQAQIPSGGNRTLIEEEALSLQFTVGGANNTYQWFKDEVAIQGATAATYAVASARQANSGSYRLEIRNSTVADLALTTQAFTVTVNLKTVETTDRAALEALYNGTNGASWTNKTGWLTDAPVGEWFGVTVELGKVVSVALTSNNLVGPLPHSLFAMQSLRSLNLSGNQLSGTMPETITGLTQLQQLYLQDNQITGRIPSALGNLTALTALDLGRNKFYGSLPSSIGSLVNLESILGLAGNDLTGTLPASLGSLTKLKILAADDNQFEGLIPAELGSMAALTELYLHKNLLSGAVPAGLSSLASLQRLYLNENALEGTFPAAIAGITALKQVALNDNKFISLPSFKNGPALDLLHIANNKVGFGSIEPNMGIADFIYSPQGRYGLPADILHNVGEDYTFELGMGGTSNSYQWFKNDQAITGATAKDLVVTNPQSDAEGVYYAKVTNSAVPDLELQTEDYNFKLSSLERDRLALIAIFNATGGTNWINKDNWGTEASLDTWSGITVANNRVTQINLPNNRIVGDIPNDIRDIGALQVVNFSNSGEAFNPDVDNQIRSMPDMSRLTTLTSVNMTRNRLGFSSIEPNYVGLADKFVFSPQRRFGETTNTQVEVGSPHRLEIQVSGNNNIYQWYFNSGAAGATDVAIAGATQRVYFIDAVNYETQGTYYAKVTSPLVPGFDLRNRNQNVQAITSISGAVTDAGAPLASGTVTLYMVRSGPYLNLGTVDLAADGTYTFAGVPLADYLLLATPPQTEGFADALKTYYSSTINWEEADILVVRAKTEGVGISLLRIPSDLGGDNVAAGVLEVDIPDEEIVDEESRVLARQRVNGAGVSLSRQRARGKGLDEEFDYEFVAYVVTDENGEFKFEGLPDAVYRINVQFPGVPMDQSSDLLLSFDENTDQDAVNLSALVTPEGISVEKVVIKGIAATYLRDLVVYPNPGEDLVQLEYFVKRKVAGLVMNIYDVRGQKMASQQLPFSRGPQNTELNLTGLAAGMYMLTITDVNNTFMETFRIQKK